MRAPSCSLVLLSALAAHFPAFAQPSASVDPVACAADIASAQDAVDLAHSKGQIVRKRQLAADLAALQKRCASSAQDPGRAASIELLEQEIRELRSRLEQAEAQLRKLRSAAS